MKALIIIGSIWFLYLGSVFGQTYGVDSVFNPKTFNNSYVSDVDRYLDSTEIDELNKLCFTIDTALNIQIAVVVLKSIEEADPLALATDIGNEWGVGKDDKGVVILAAIQNRSMAIATGEAIESQLSDWRTNKIREEFITPYFKDGKYGAGLIAGVNEIRDEVIASIDLAIENEKSDVLYKQERQVRMVHLSRVRFFLLFVFGVLLIFVIFKYVKWFSRWSFLATLVSCMLTGISATLLHWVFVQSDEEPLDIENIIGVLSLVSFFLSIMSLYVIYMKELLWESVYIGFLYLLAIMVVWNFTYLERNDDFVMGLDQLEDFKFYLGLIFFPALIIVVSVVFILIMLQVYSSSDPYIRYQRVAKIPDIFLVLFPVLLPFPFLTLKMYKEKYKVKFRFQKRYSLSTGLPMKRAADIIEDRYLNKLQIAEEKAKSVDYDVWYSEEKGDVLVLEYTIHSYKRGKCKKCGEKTVKNVLSKMIKRATEEETGEMEVKILCCNCHSQEFINMKIARVRPSYDSYSTGSGSSYSSSSSSYSSSRSSSSSSRSSSGGSWGGGSFGGGGSKGRW